MFSATRCRVSRTVAAIVASTPSTSSRSATVARWSRASPPKSLANRVATSGSTHRIVRAVRDGSDLRLVIATGCDGRDQAAGLLIAEVARLRLFGHLFDRRLAERD